MIKTILIFMIDYVTWKLGLQQNSAWEMSHHRRRFFIIFSVVIHTAALLLFCDHVGNTSGKTCLTMVCYGRFSVC